MEKTYSEIAGELRTQLNNLIDVLDGDGFCTSRDCMCDHSAPIVKLNAAITELERKGDPYVDEPMHQRMGL